MIITILIFFISEKMIKIKISSLMRTVDDRLRTSKIDENKKNVTYAHRCRLVT